MDRKVEVIVKRRPRIFRWFGAMILLFLGSIVAGTIHRSYKDPIARNPTHTEDPRWASQSYGLAPHPADWQGPIVQVYSARTWGAKEALAVHTWIATKRTGSSEYQISQVLGWRLRRRGKALYTSPGVPDQDWYGKEPTLLLDLRGSEVDGIIDKLDSAIAQYPWAREYTIWPGPNSNTFVAWLGLVVPEMGLDLPSTAIGKDWRPLKQSIGISSSGTGLQASLYGLLGASVGYEEGVEVNILGLSAEVDIFDLAVELPGIGRIGKAPVSPADHQSQ